MIYNCTSTKSVQKAQGIQQNFYEDFSKSLASRMNVLANFNRLLAFGYGVRTGIAYYARIVWAFIQTETADPNQPTCSFVR